MPNLYFVQDDDRPMWVAANSMEHAISKWKDLIIEENGPVVDATPRGVQFVCDDYEYLP